MNNDFLVDEQENTGYRLSDYDPTLNELTGWMGFIIVTYILALVLYPVLTVTVLIKFGFSTQTIFIMIQALIQCALAGLVLFYIFKRDIKFKKYMIVELITGALLLILFMAIFGTKINLVSAIISGTIRMVIWISYLNKSSRVRNIFIYPKLDIAQEEDERFDTEY